MGELETRFNGAGNVPVNPPESPIAVASEKPSISKDEDDDESRLIATHLLNSLKKNTDRD